MAAVAVELNKILISETGGSQMIVLKEVEGTRVVPIWIGMPEALAIHRRIQGEAPPRPLTHDLLASVIETLGAKVARVVIDQFVATPSGGTFHAKLVLQRGDETLLVDARPSDAIALAVRSGAPIFIEEEILEEEGQDLAKARPSAEEGERWTEEAEEGEGGDDDADDGEEESREEDEDKE